MVGCSKQIIRCMHDYFDDELKDAQEQQLKEHLKACPDCMQHFTELEKTLSFLKGDHPLSAPDGFKDKVMNNLPPNKRKWKHWITKHPIIVAASLFIMFISGSLFSTWNNSDEFAYTKDNNLIVKNHTVIVPKGKEVKKDLMVKNGDILIEGKVDGDVTIINGENNLASVGYVTGNIKAINDIFDWVWFKMKHIGKILIPHY